jgi:hypothetical protein
MGWGGLQGALSWLASSGAEEWCVIWKCPLREQSLSFMLEELSRCEVIVESCTWKVKLVPPIVGSGE